MPRVKRGVTARARHKKVLDLAKGYRGRRKNVFRIAKEAVMKAGQYAVPRPPHEEARVPRAVDRAHQRGGARARPDVQRVHERPEEGVDRHRPQGAGRPRRARHGRRSADREQAQGRSWPDRLAAGREAARSDAAAGTAPARACRCAGISRATRWTISNRIVDERAGRLRRVRRRRPSSRTRRRATSARPARSPSS